MSQPWDKQSGSGQHPRAGPSSYGGSPSDTAGQPSLSSGDTGEVGPFQESYGKLGAYKLPKSPNPSKPTTAAPTGLRPLIAERYGPLKLTGGHGGGPQQSQSNLAPSHQTAQNPAGTLHPGSQGGYQSSK